MTKKLKQRLLIAVSILAVCSLPIYNNIIHPMFQLANYFANPSNRYLYTGLHKAAERGKLGDVKFHVEVFRTPINKLEGDDTALSVALVNGNYEIATYLRKNGADLRFEPQGGDHTTYYHFRRESPDATRIWMRDVYPLYGSVPPELDR